MIALFTHSNVMLLQFSVSNYRSFRKLQTLRLAASAQDKTLPQNCIMQEFPGDMPKRWLKGAAIYGANASGKTTVLKALRALARIITTSARSTDPKDPIRAIEPFALRPGGDTQPTMFEAIIFAEDVRYAYRVAVTRERVWHESLRAYPHEKAQTWFNREWNPDDQKYEWTPERPTGFQRDQRLENDTLSNMLFLSKHIASNRTEMEPVFRWFKERLIFFQLDSSLRMNPDQTLDTLREKTELFGPILELLRHADIGVTGARAVERPESSQPMFRIVRGELQKVPSDETPRMPRPQSFRPQLFHQGDGNTEIPLPWTTESAGTQRLFALAGPWLEFIKREKVLCIDELETSMHPLMVMELLKVLFSEQTNSGRAQVIFTTHNPLLLDLKLLRRDQVWLTDKDAEGEGHLYPLTDYAPRKDESLLRGYMSGRYGGVPFLPKGLLGQQPGYKTIDETEAAPDE